MSTSPESVPTDLAQLRHTLCEINASAAQTDEEISELSDETDETIGRCLIVQGKLEVVATLLRSGEL